MIGERNLDFYAVLGVAREAPQQQIKESYRSLVRLHHPDANPLRRDEAEAMMKRVIEAYSILGDEDKRARYETELRLRQLERPKPAAAPIETVLLVQVREILGLTAGELAARLGMALRQMEELEARDAIPQSPVQLRTFALLCEQAAQNLEKRGQSSAAQELRAQLSSKRARQAIFR